MDNYTQILENQQSFEANLSKRMLEFEQRLNQTTPDYNKTVAGISDEFQLFKRETLSIFSLLRQQISGLVDAIDVMEMRHRRKYLLIGGISEDVKDDNLVGFASQLIRNQLDLPQVTVDKLTVCHRLGKQSQGKPRPTLVRFAEATLKSVIWKKTGFRGTPYSLSEFLTRRRQSLFLQARERFGMRKCWTFDGNINVLTPDGSRHRLRGEEDLVRLAESMEDLKDGYGVAVAAETDCGQSSNASPEARGKKTKRAVRKK
ncbi:uncharacterized protein LOC131850809 [Achroia grisella]|uniref:uncharacterized protein LOC131850809 n=1 Tax=Achroia grisella TaxID=688607 RepID=UPI0027D2CDF4|nr:uncharacterized protein LOC131850809 [Achroia grisella]